MLFLRVDTAPEVTISTVSSAASTRVVTVDGIGEVIPGFPDGLMAVKRSDGQSLGLVLWPERGAPSERSVPVGASSPPDPVAFDVSGRLLATMLPAPGEVGGVLYAGVPDAARIIALDVTGHAWHDSDPSALAYTSAGDGETMLWVTRGNLTESELVTETAGEEAAIAAWGAWGYALQDGESAVLLTDTGETSQTSSGRILSSNPDGLIALDDDGLKLLSVSGEVREVPGFGFEGPVLAASFAPAGGLLGVLTVEGLAVTSGEAEVAEALERPGVPQVVWSSDGRYVLYPGLRGVVVLDTSDGSVRELMPESIFTGFAVLDFDGS